MKSARNDRTKQNPVCLSCCSLIYLMIGWQNLEGKKSLCIFLPLQYLPVSSVWFVFVLSSWIIPFYTHNSIEKVQLPDMGSYRCAVLSETHQTFSEEGSIQLEGEFMFSYKNKPVSSKCYSFVWIVKRVETLIQQILSQVFLISLWSPSTCL